MVFKMNLAQLEAAHRAAEDLRRADSALNDLTVMDAPKIEIRFLGENPDSTGSRRSATLIVSREQAFKWVNAIVAEREAALKALGVDIK